MIRRLALAALALVSIATFAPAQEPTAPLGSPAPEFKLTDTDGNVVTLSGLRGKVVVLEWFNPDCPFVKQAHGENGALKTMAATWAAKGVTWLAINSSAEGKQGYGLDRNKQARTDYGMTYPVLLDPEGIAGRLYGAKSTPHVFVIDSKGTLVYKGGVDNAPMGEVQDGTARVAYLQAALEEVTAGKPVTTAETRHYGCSVKYATK